MLIRTALNCDVEHVIENMRAMDEKEIFAMVDHDRKQLLADYIKQMSGYKINLAAFNSDGECCVIFSVSEHHCKRGTLQLIATDNVRSIIKSLTRHIKNLLKNMNKIGFRRVECRSLKNWEVNNRWLALLGGKLECELPKFGKNNEDFLQHSWTLGE